MTGLEITTFLVVAGILSVWHANTVVWFVAFGLIIAAALVTSSLSLVALPSLAILVLLVWGYSIGGKYWWCYFAGMILLGVALGLHIVPGYNNHEFLASHHLSDSSAEMAIWFNYDKSLFGLVVLGFVLRPVLIRKWVDFRTFVGTLVPIVLVALPMVYFLGVVTGYSRIDFTPSMVFLPWALKNLFFTVLAEEVMFRGLIQRELISRIDIPGAPVIGILVGGTLFGVAHFAGGPGYVFLSTVAGCIYGYAYYATGRIEATIATHFLLNAGHFLFFTYPYLAI